MPLQKLQFRPGINRETTSYTNEGGWFDGDKVRFRFGTPEKLGGWTTNSKAYFLGTCRALHPWTSADGDFYLAVGTNLKYYIQSGGTYYDITPLRSTDVGVSIFAATAPDELDGAITADQEDILLDDAAGFPSSGVVKIGTEHILYASVDGDTLRGCVRGFDSTTAVAHADAAVVDCATIKVAQTAHGALADSFVTFSDAASLGGNVTAAVLNQEYQIRAVTDDEFLFEARQLASLTDITTSTGYTPVYVFANASDTGTGKNTFTNSTVDTTSGDATCTMDATIVLVVGAPISGTGIPASTTVLSITDATTFELSANATATNTNITATITTTTAAYQVNAGSDTGAVGRGWGIGPWGRQGWGEPANAVDSTESRLRTWSQDNFFDDLILNSRGGGVYYWDSSDGLINNRAVNIASAEFGTTFQTPTVASQVMISDRDAHVIAFGTNTAGTTEQDPLLIRFSDQGNPRDWAITETNTAGDLVLSAGSRIITAVETRQQILVFTDVSVHSMQFLGPPYTFGVNIVSDNVTINGPLSAINVEDTVYWMGQDEFYLYNGSVQRLPCTVRDYVFSDFNTEQADKSFAASNAAFGEIWWFYPSLLSDENDRYVVYNYQENVWFYGTLPRTAWISRGANKEPISASTDNRLYFQESGDDDGSTSPSTAIDSYIESSPITMENGDNFMLLTRLIPDITFRSSSGSPSVSMTLQAKRFPGASYAYSDASTVTRTAVVPVEQFTEQVNVRLRGRSFSFRIDSEQREMQWRLGTPRVDIRPDGRR
tara:strand:+ start:2791 stop:5112 length:2322 start_codon:yes stop_codon:yes gene_type:complete